MHKFPQRLKELLAEKGLSQRAFARHQKLDSKIVNNWCTGRTEPNLSQIIMICEYFNESADYLLGITDN